jgi:hypothetical protein
MNLDGIQAAVLHPKAELFIEDIPGISWLPKLQHLAET